ncbi:uncharacterized protein [Watersipora subatra]|uniref:uncharacterized protein isoform X2 n=1 Tax=Watersipora subatra TaxID=2589382 RepID=UPI00355B35E8
MGTYYHQESLRKQRMLERTKAARDKTEHRGGYDSMMKNMMTAVEAPAKVAMERKQNYEATTNNRFQSGDPVHVDRIYSVMYPDRNNSSYKDDASRTNRIKNMAESRYDMLVKLNGPLHVQLVNERLMCEEK